VYERIGGYAHQEFKFCCDYEFILRLGREGCKVGHVPALLVDFRFHDGGLSGDLRVDRSMRLETARIRRKYGCPGGLWGGVLAQCHRAKRQIQKLRHRGACDLISGRSLLKKHLREKAGVSSRTTIDGR
jgi:GT2 family glycosyltransferase